ncbi:MAG TPA: hypothetical protein VI979_04160 [archaeon]|nr:hypothetical protein [archaeon]
MAAESSISGNLGLLAQDYAHRILVDTSALSEMREFFPEPMDFFRAVSPQDLDIAALEGFRNSFDDYRAILESGKIITVSPVVSEFERYSRLVGRTSRLLAAIRKGKSKKVRHTEARHYEATSWDEELALPRKPDRYRAAGITQQEMVIAETVSAMKQLGRKLDACVFMPGNTDLYHDLEDIVMEIGINGKAGKNDEPLFDENYNGADVSVVTAALYRTLVGNEPVAVATRDNGILYLLGSACNYLSFIHPDIMRALHDYPVTVAKTFNYNPDNFVSTSRFDRGHAQLYPNDVQRERIWRYRVEEVMHRIVDAPKAAMIA